VEQHGLTLFAAHGRPTALAGRLQRNCTL
jgi:hypothetical protein